MELMHKADEHGGQGAGMPASAPARILAVDLGARRMGLAVSDPLRITAQGLPTAERRNKREDMNYLKSLIRKFEVGLVLIGHPLHMDGSHGLAADAAARFAAALARHTGIEVQLWDERLTSSEANRLMRDAGVDPRRRASHVDQMAASLLLQNFLEAGRFDARSAPAATPPEHA